MNYFFSVVKILSDVDQIWDLKLAFAVMLNVKILASFLKETNIISNIMKILQVFNKFKKSNWNLLFDLRLF